MDGALLTSLTSLGENTSLVVSGVAKSMQGSNTRYPNFLLAAADFISDKSIAALQTQINKKKPRT